MLSILVQTMRLYGVWFKNYNMQKFELFFFLDHPVVEIQTNSKATGNMPNVTDSWSWWHRWTYCNKLNKLIVLYIKQENDFCKSFTYLIQSDKVRHKWQEATLACSRLLCTCTPFFIVQLEFNSHWILLLHLLMICASQITDYTPHLTTSSPGQPA